MADGRPSGTGTVVAAIPVALGLLATAINGTPGDATERARRPAGTTHTERARFDAGPVVEAAAARGHLNVYFGNLHAHTSLSDGVEEPQDAYAFARDEAGLDFMALSEHNHAQAGRIANNHSLYSGSQADSLISVANRMTENGRFVALYGQEFSTISSGNHMNVLDVPRVIGVANGAFDSLLNDFLPNNHDTTGGLAVLLLNHPATSGSGAENEYGRDDFGSDAEWIRRMRDHASLIAMINGPSHQDGTGLPPGQPAEGEVFRYLNLGFLLAPTADQDNHKPNWGATTEARTAVIADELSKPALLRAMKARHVYATEDSNLRVVCRVNGHLCGDRIAAPAAGTELQIELTLHDDDEPSASYEIDVFSDDIGDDPARNPTEVVAQEGNTAVPLKIQDIRYSGGSQYVFFRIRQQTDDDEDRAWTSPVWLEPGGPPPLPTPEDASGFVASRNSRIFHPDATCSSARDIKPQNRVTGAEARRGRTAHQGCPR